MLIAFVNSFSCLISKILYHVATIIRFTEPVNQNLPQRLFGRPNNLAYPVNCCFRACPIAILNFSPPLSNRE
jgi:hypothetical protein